MSYFQYDNLYKIHVEISSLCNSMCPNCPRYFMHSPNTIPQLIPQSISIESFKEWFPPELLNRIGQLIFCGNHGDPCTCKDLLPIMEYVYENTDEDMQFQMHSNVGMKSPKTWERIGELFSRRWNWNMIFSIDGLEDTNHLYRRNVRWSKVEANVKAFTTYGGNCDWEYLIFKHNEHQIDEAKKLSEEWGVTAFVPKIAGGLDNGENQATMDVVNAEGKSEYMIYPPTDPKNRADYMGGDPNKISVRSFEHNPESINVIQENTTLPPGKIEEWDNTPIKQRCLKEVYVAADGFVTPCCWMGINTVMINADNKVPTSFANKQLQDKLREHGFDNFSLYKRTLKEMLDDELLDKVYSNDWDKTTSCGKLAHCTETCGKPHILDDIRSHEGNPYKDPYEGRHEDPFIYD